MARSKLYEPSTIERYNASIYLAVVLPE